MSILKRRAIDNCYVWELWALEVVLMAYCEKAPYIRLIPSWDLSACISLIPIHIINVMKWLIPLLLLYKVLIAALIVAHKIDLEMENQQPCSHQLPWSSNITTERFHPWTTSTRVTETHLALEQHSWEEVVDQLLPLYEARADPAAFTWQGLADSPSALHCQDRRTVASHIRQNGGPKQWNSSNDLCRNPASCRHE